MANRPFPINATLTAIAIGYRNPAHTFIAKRVLPSLQVLSEQFKWHEYPLTEGFELVDTRVGRKGRPNQVEFTVTERDGSTTDHGLDDAIPFSDIREAATARAEKRGTFDPRETAVEGITNYLMIAREVRAAAIVQNPDNFATDKKIVLVGDDKFSNFEKSDPFGVIDEGMEKTLIYRPNHIAMGQPVWSKVKRHPRLIKAVKGGLAEDGAISRQQFADLFEIPLEGLLIGEARLNTAKKGQGPAMSRIWGNHIELLYLDTSKATPKDGKISFGFTAECGNKISGSIEDKDIGLEGGERVRVGEKVGEFICAKDVGYQIRDVL